MKKRILALFVTAVLVVSSLFSLTACNGKKGNAEKYTYVTCSVNRSVFAGYDTFDETMEFVYSDTKLKLYDDGTWSIDTTGLFSSEIDEGTYTVNGNKYTFSGFEYGMKTEGYKSGNQFIIEFKAPNGYGYTTAMSLTYEA